MASKRVSPKVTTKRKASAAHRPAAGAVGMSLESKPVLTSLTAGIDPEARRRLVEAEAYFLAERRGFVPGNELQDWAIAEAAVDSRLQGPHLD
jgi:hypothetical protein